MNIKFRGGLLGLKRLHRFLEVTTAQVHNGNYAKRNYQEESFTHKEEMAPMALSDSEVSTKKTQKTLLKQQYENFSATSAESLDSIFNRLQKIVSRLAILGVVIAQEDLNSKFLSSLPPEWNTHVVVWMNKPEVKTMSIDDLYNNFKIIEQKVKKTVGGNSGAQNLAFMIAPSTNSTNNINTASPQVSTASVSDNTVYAFMVENPNGSNVLHQDLEQIHEDDLEEMDLKWHLSLLSVECYNCNKLGHFARECRAPRSKESQFRNQVNTRKQGNNKDKSSKAMLAIDGVDSEVYPDKTCSKTCLKNYETLKKQCDDLLVKLNESEFKATTYKRGLATLEDQIITYKKNEVLFSEEIGVLKRDVACKDYEINVLKSELEKVKQEKDGIAFKIEKFDKASKDLDQLLGSQITNKCIKGLGYSVVLPPHPLIYNRPNKLDLSYSGLDEFKEPEFKGYGPKDSEQKSNVVCDKKSDNSKKNYEESLVAEQVSHDTSSFVKTSPKVDKETVFLVNKKVEFTKSENHEKPVKKSVRRNYQEESFTHKEAMAPMALSDSEVKTSSKTYLKNYETLKKQCDDLLVKLNVSEFKTTTYKRGLGTLEDQIITYKKNEVLFSEEIGVLKRDVACKDYEINFLKSELEKVKQEKDGIDFQIEKFDKASKDLE
ncbi:putative ribonuclease H-like domain-containing protein [Tanacetum coccineum]